MPTKEGDRERQTERERERQRQRARDRQTDKRQTDRVNYILIFKKAMFGAFCWPRHRRCRDGRRKKAVRRCVHPLEYFSIALRFLPSFLPSKGSHFCWDGACRYTEWMIIATGTEPRAKRYYHLIRIAPLDEEAPEIWSITYREMSSQCRINRDI